MSLFILFEQNFLPYLTESEIDFDNFQAMNSLGCFKDKEKLKQELLKPDHNTGIIPSLIIHSI